jgi:hypothetical protein
MAIVHRAELTPSKIDLVNAWLRGQDWYTGDGAAERESAFRFDDPAGEVGIETFIVRCGDARFHVPLTYRSGPLDGGRLVGELEHSVLGHRWVYDGPSDPVYVAVVTSVIVAGGRDVDMVLDDGTPVPRLEWWATATGSGAARGQAAGTLRVARLLPADAPEDAPRLVASWSMQESPTVVAWLED